MNLKLNFSYTPAQLKVFDENNPRFITVAKGRRLGFTRGCAKYVVENLIEGKKVLWVDTIQANLQNYFDIYFIPELKNLPSYFFDWNSQNKRLNFYNGAFLHMKSAEKPENIEGLAYDLTILNEAGIILGSSKANYLWYNAVRPMLLDNPKSRAIIGGVPKGKNLFYELCRKELSDKNWKHFQFSSFENPFIEKEQIQELIEEVGGEGSEVVKQEIYGEFVDSALNEVFNQSEIEEAFKNINIPQHLFDGAYIWGLDVARYGDDKSVLAKRMGNVIETLNKYTNLDTIELANRVIFEFNQSEKKPNAIFIDTCGIGVGVFDVLQNYGLPVFEANAARKATQKGFLNKRAQMYTDFAKNLKNMKISADDELKKELRSITYSFNNTGLKQIISKDDLKREIGKSSDCADAIALTFYEKINIRNNTNEDWSYDGW